MTTKKTATKKTATQKTTTQKTASTQSTKKVVTAKERYDIIVKRLENGQTVQVKPLCTEFNTKYKNITGVLYEARKAGMKLDRVWNSEARCFEFSKKADKK